ncbi:MAG: hypothetical protein INQ03_19630 [Candidatus Heimdallarchaeota archaeon]|nr:hypothetical protein [Candidatus Heimdallarchaeota archaeon]
MKILIPSIEEDSNLNSQPAKIFGNAKSFLIYDTDEDSFASIENTFDFDNKIVAELHTLEIDNIITEAICVACFKNISSSNIDIWEDDGSFTIRETYQKFLLGGFNLMLNPGSMTMHQPDRHLIRRRSRITV